MNKRSRQFCKMLMIIDYRNSYEYEDSYYRTFLDTKNVQTTILFMMDFYNKISRNYRHSILQNDCLKYSVPDFEMD